MNPATGPRPFLSWRAKILPYLELQAIADESEASFAKQNSPFRPVPHPALGRVVPAFACPADDRTATAWRLPTNPTLGPIAMSSYLGNSGTTSRERNGVFSTGSRTELLHITDGTSQTLLIGERPPSADLIVSWWYAGIGLGGGGKLEHHMGVVETGGRGTYHGCGEGPYAFGPGKVTEHCDAFHYWSLHGGGANFAFADGSVRFMSYGSHAVMPALATRSGQEAVDGGF